MSTRKLRQAIDETINTYKKQTTALEQCVSEAILLTKTQTAQISNMAEYAASNLEEIRALLKTRNDLRTNALEAAVTLERRQLEYSRQEDMGGFVHAYNNQLSGLLIILPEILGLSGRETLELVRQLAADKSVIGKDGK